MRMTLSKLRTLADLVLQQLEEERQFFTAVERLLDVFTPKSIQQFGSCGDCDRLCDHRWRDLQPMFQMDKFHSLLHVP